MSFGKCVFQYTQLVLSSGNLLCSLVLNFRIKSLRKNFFMGLPFREATKTLFMVLYKNRVFQHLSDTHNRINV